MATAGKRRHKITIQTPTETRSASGSVVQTWGTYCIRWAAVKTIGGREALLARQVFGQRTIKFVIPYDTTGDGITTKMRITWDSRTFDIQDKENIDERNREIILICLERNV